MASYNPKSKVILSAKSIRASKFNKSLGMKEMMQDKDIKRTLDKASEKNEFYKVLTEEAHGGRVTKSVAKRTLGRLRANPGAIDRKEAGVLKRKILGTGIGTRIEDVFVEEKKSSQAYIVKPRDNSPAGIETKTVVPAGKISGKTISTASLKKPPSVPSSSSYGFNSEVKADKKSSIYNFLHKN